MTVNRTRPAFVGDLDTEMSSRPNLFRIVFEGLTGKHDGFDARGVQVRELGKNVCIV